ncbi:glyoxalase [bacterium]|nr:MAG: glyoxalase [bacterium]
MPEPVFTETMQIGIVVRDLDAAVKRYEEDYGIGPWEFFAVDAEKAPDILMEGGPIGPTRNATAKVGSVWWELTQPMDEESIFARFLTERGGGVHHIAVKAPDYEGVLAMQTEPLPLTGSFMDVQVSYLPTERDLGVILEVFKGDPGGAKTDEE